MKKGWEVKRLGEIARITYGYTEKASYEEIGPKFLRITDIQENGVNWDLVPYCKCNEGELLKYKLETGDIVFARTGATTGKSYLLKNPPNAVFASYLIKLQLKDKRNFIPEYIAYFFQTKIYWDEINKGMSGSAQGGFNATKLGEMSLSFPKSIEEQQRIVAILDKAFDEIEKVKKLTEQNLKNAKELFESYLQGVFENKGENWEEKEFGSFITILTDYHANGSYEILKKNVELKNTEDYAWMVRSTDFENDFKNELRYISKSSYDYLEKSRIFGNEIIMSKIGNAGKVYLMPEITRPCSLAMNLFLIRVDEKIIDPKYVFIFLNTKNGTKQINSRLNGTATKTITKDNVRSIKIIIPPLQEQEKIILRLDELSAETKRLETIYQQKLDSLEELKKSILQKAFNGEL